LSSIYKGILSQSSRVIAAGAKAGITEDFPSLVSAQRIQGRVKVIIAKTQTPPTLFFGIFCGLHNSQRNQRKKSEKFNLI
jgi:hypothetical protein